MNGQWIIKEVYFEDGFPKIIRDLKPETPDIPPEVTPDVKPVQVSLLEFIAAALDREFLYGKPIMWAEWPNRDKNNG
jgi:hypothetical protein